MNISDQNPAAERLQPITRPLRPLHDRLLVRRLEDNANQSQLELPETAQIASKFGQIVAAGPGIRDSYGVRRPLEVAVGDFVYFGRFTDYDDGTLVIVQEADIVGVVDK